MKKISTLYKKDPNDLSMVINEIAPENKWVIDGEGIPTRKFDGTATAIIDGELYKRYDVKKGKQVPANAIPCQEPDEITGHWPHWIKCYRSNPADKWHFEGFENMLKTAIVTANFDPKKFDGTYELCGEKLQGNPEHLTGHILVKHGIEVLPVTDFSFEGLKNYLSNPELDIEGIVFHHKNDGRMCKIRKCDFGIKRAVL
jgi:hypothetical protein